MKNTLLEIAATIGIGATGGIAHYLLKIKNGAQWSWAIFFINLILSGFVGWLVSLLIQEGVNYREFIIAVSGYSSNEVLNLIENKGIKFINDKFFK